MLTALPLFADDFIGRRGPPSGVGAGARPHTTGTLSGPRGWSQDVSEAMACKVLELAERDDYELTEGTLAFVEAHSPRVVQPTLPLW